MGFYLNKTLTTQTHLKMPNSRAIRPKKLVTKIKKKSKPPRHKVSFARKFYAVLTRALFILHTMLAVWRIYLVYDILFVYILAFGLLFLILELIFTLTCREGAEQKWCCPSVFFYLLCVVPCLWGLELKEIEEINRYNNRCSLTMNETVGSTTINTTLALSPRRRRAASVIPSALNRSTLAMSTASMTTNKSDTTATQLFTTNKSDTTSTQLITTNKSDTTATQLLTTNKTTTTYPQNTTAATIGLEETTTLSTSLGHFQDIKNQVFDKASQYQEHVQQQFSDVIITLDSLEPKRWKLALHQTLLFVLVIGRWLLPNDGITRDQLSQLLLVFIAVGADILEFVTETIDEENLQDCRNVIVFFLYTTWSCSLFQFTLVLTATKSRKVRLGFANESNTKIAEGDGCCARSIFNSAEVWGIMVTIILQDVPFLVFRLYVMIVYQDVHQMMIFFTGKNILVVILQLYRL